MKRVVVIGAGPAGLMASIEASKKHEVILIEKNEICGRKLLLTGNGRCNITNNKKTDEFLSHCSKSSRFLHSALSQFSVKDCIAFFESRHCPLVEEIDNRMYPKSQDAQSILDVLLKECIASRVNFWLETSVGSLLVEDQKIVDVKTDKGDVKCDIVIVATGGMSFPLTGSSGDGHGMLSRIGHTVTSLHGVEVPLICQDEVIQSKKLQGLTLQNAMVSVVSQNKIVKETMGDLIFTHFGLSGPAILYLSEWVYHTLQKSEVKIRIRSSDKHEKELLDSMNHSTLNQWSQFIRPKRWREYLLDGFDGKTKLDQMSKEDKLQIIENVLRKEFKITDTLSLDRAFVTAGGIKTSEIDPVSMKSKLMDNLYICGELLDCHGELGGYNLTIAMVSGYVAGKHC